MAIKRQIKGKRFGRLVALTNSYRIGDSKNYRVRCKCDCGKEVVVHYSAISSGQTQSCGCLHRERSAEAGRKTLTSHGLTGTKEHRSWTSMIRRCDPSRNHSRAPDKARNYLDRGIVVCAEWTGPDGFVAFLDDLGRAPSPEHTLERIDNDRGYEPGNVRWATRAEQSRNTRRTKKLMAFGKTMCLADWAVETGIHAATINGRLRRGWTLEDALTRQPQKKKLSPPDPDPSGTKRKRKGALVTITKKKP